MTLAKSHPLEVFLFHCHFDWNLFILVQQSRSNQSTPSNNSPLPTVMDFDDEDADALEDEIARLEQQLKRKQLEVKAKQMNAELKKVEPLLDRKEVKVLKDFIEESTNSAMEEEEPVAIQETQYQYYTDSTKVYPESVAPNTEFEEGSDYTEEEYEVEYIDEEEEYEEEYIDEEVSEVTEYSEEEVEVVEEKQPASATSSTVMGQPPSKPGLPCSPVAALFKQESGQGSAVLRYLQNQKEESGGESYPGPVVQKQTAPTKATAHTHPKAIAQNKVAPAPKNISPAPQTGTSKVRPPPNKGGKPKIPAFRRNVKVAGDQKHASPDKPKKMVRRIFKRKKVTNKEKDTSAEVKKAEPVKVAPAASTPAPAPRGQPPVQTSMEPIVKVVTVATSRTQNAIPRGPFSPTSSSSSQNNPAPFKRRTIPNVPPSPAGQETLWEELLGPKLITNSKLLKSSTVGCLQDQALIGLYFASKFNGDSKRFNPHMLDFYYSAAQQNRLEVVYISSDRNRMDFQDFYGRMPFLAMPPGTSDYKNKLARELKVIDMPTLVVLDATGKVVTVQGVQQVQQLERGNVEQATELITRWKKTRPIERSQVKQDMSLVNGNMQRGFLHWS
jgi:hypothetical protein